MNDGELFHAIGEMDDEMETIIGRKVFGHVAHPTPTSVRITFADAHVALSWADAHEYMVGLLRLARQDPGKLPWPLNEPV